MGFRKRLVHALAGRKCQAAVLMTALIWGAPNAQAQPAVVDLLNAPDDGDPTPGSVDESAGNPVPSNTIPDAKQSDQRSPVPAEAQSRIAVDKVQQIFQSEFASATSREQRIALSEQLFAQALRTKQAVDRWALLAEAARIAADAGDPDATFKVLDAVIGGYAVDPLVVRLDAITRLAQKVSPANASDLAVACMGICRERLQSGDLAGARKLLAMAGSLARKNPTRSMTAELNALTIAIKDAEKHARDLKSIREKLAASPDDPAVLLEAGRFYCFKTDNWAAGLPLLARGSDAELATLARNELRPRQNAKDAAALGDQWWKWGERQANALKSRAMVHASELYRESLPAIDGLEKLRVEKNIQAAERLARETVGAGPARKLPGLLVWLDATTVATRVTGADKGTPLKPVQVIAWEDLSGNGNHAKQDTVSLQPTLRAGSGAKDAGVVFTGGQVLHLPVKTRTAGTMVVSLTPSQVANMHAIGFRTSEQAGLQLSLYTTGGVRFEALTRGGFVGAGSQTGNYEASKKMVIFGFWGPGLSMGLDGKLVLGPPAVDGLPESNRDWAIGSAVLPNPQVGFQGAIHTVMIFDRVLSEKEISQLAIELGGLAR